MKQKRKNFKHGIWNHYNDFKQSKGNKDETSQSKE